MSEITYFHVLGVDMILYIILEIDECASNPCINGECDNQIGKFVCACNLGYEGTVCEIG